MKIHESVRENSKSLIEERGLKVSESLTGTDKMLISRQCILQHATSDEQLTGFAEAYTAAKKLSKNKKELDGLTAEELEELIIDWGIKIEARNKKGYRTTEVSFANLSRALDPALIERVISNLTRAFAENTLSPIEFYTEFEKIHPFEDGNGRVGDLLWKIAVTRETGKWPEELPPDVFGVHQKE